MTFSLSFEEAAAGISLETDERDLRPDEACSYDYSEQPFVVANLLTAVVRAISKRLHPDNTIRVATMRWGQ